MLSNNRKNCWLIDITQRQWHGSSAVLVVQSWRKWCGRLHTLCEEKIAKENIIHVHKMLQEGCQLLFEEYMQGKKTSINE